MSSPLHMLPPSHIFRAYDIRGIADTELTEESIRLIGQGTGTYFIRQLKGTPRLPAASGGPLGMTENQHLAVGRDNRIHSQKLQAAFIKGLLESGCDVTNIGLAPSPLLYYATCIPEFGFDGGINITASHNPKEYNGIKTVRRNAESVAGAELQDILALCLKQDFETGSSEYHENESIFQHYTNFVTAQGKFSQPLKIVIDAGNGITSIFAPELFRQLGAEVHELHCELDGTFPNHEANPEKEENLVCLKNKVLELKADLGIGFDGDGDRVGFIDENGTFYAADKILIAFSRDILSRNPAAKIVFDVKCSQLLENDIKKHGGIAIMSKTGHSFMEQAIKKEHALLGGEVSGHTFFAENFFGFDDAMYAAFRLVKILDQKNLPLSKILQDLPEMHTTPELKAACPDDQKFQIMEEIKNHFQKLYPCITLDGVRMNFNQTDWAIIRCSNTGPHFTMRFEAQTKENLEKMKKIVFAKLEEYPSVQI